MKKQKLKQVAKLVNKAILTGSKISACGKYQNKVRAAARSIVRDQHAVACTSLDEAISLVSASDIVASIDLFGESTVMGNRESTQNCIFFVNHLGKAFTVGFTFNIVDVEVSKVVVTCLGKDTDVTHRFDQILNENLNVYGDVSPEILTEIWSRAILALLVEFAINAKHSPDINAFLFEEEDDFDDELIEFDEEDDAEEEQTCHLNVASLPVSGAYIYILDLCLGKEPDFSKDKLVKLLTDLPQGARLDLVNYVADKEEDEVYSRTADQDIEYLTNHFVRTAQAFVESDSENAEATTIVMSSWAPDVIYSSLKQSATIFTRSQTLARIVAMSQHSPDVIQAVVGWLNQVTPNTVNLKADLITQLVDSIYGCDKDPGMLTEFDPN